MARQVTYWSWNRISAVRPLQNKRWATVVLQFSIALRYLNKDIKAKYTYKRRLGWYALPPSETRNMRPHKTKIITYSSYFGVQVPANARECCTSTAQAQFQVPQKYEYNCKQQIEDKIWPAWTPIRCYSASIANTHGLTHLNLGRTEKINMANSNQPMEALMMIILNKRTKGSINGFAFESGIITLIWLICKSATFSFYYSSDAWNLFTIKEEKTLLYITIHAAHFKQRSHRADFSGAPMSNNSVEQTSLERGWHNALQLPEGRPTSDASWQKHKANIHKYSIKPIDRTEKKGLIGFTCTSNTLLEQS